MRGGGKADGPEEREKAIKNKRETENRVAAAEIQRGTKTLSLLFRAGMLRRRENDEPSGIGKGEDGRGGGGNLILPCVEGRRDIGNWIHLCPFPPLLQTQLDCLSFFFVSACVLYSSPVRFPIQVLALFSSSSD